MESEKMNRIEAMQELLNGKKIRATEWNKKEYYYMKDRKIYDENDNENEDILFKHFQNERLKWELYKDWSLDIRQFKHNDNSGFVYGYTSEQIEELYYKIVDDVDEMQGDGEIYVSDLIHILKKRFGKK